MFQPSKCFIVAGAYCLLALSSPTFASSETTGLEKSLSSLVASQDYRAASAAAFRLASAYRRHGDTIAACAVLAQSLEYYRRAVSKETGLSEPAASSLDDDSDGMAEVRAKSGCKRS